MNISFRTRRFFRRLGLTLLWILLLGLLVWGIWMIWLQRHVVYTSDGAVFDFNLSAAELTGEEAVPPAAGETVAIHYMENSGIEDEDDSNELAQILGYVVTTDALLENQASIQQQVEALPAGTAVMVDVKSIYGNFYYNTSISGATTSGSIDSYAMDELISTMQERGLYAIARLPAFCDRNYGEKNVSSGLPVEGGYLWSDENDCYWLDPADEGTINYLTQIISELRELGFDEVVFTHFMFPDSDGLIVYESSSTEAEIIKSTAAQLVSTCATGSFAVSFQADTSFSLPSGRSRLYVEGIEAEQAATTAAQIKVDNPIVNLVFLATSNDTRYNSYCVLREMSVGQSAAPEETTAPEEG